MWESRPYNWGKLIPQEAAGCVPPDTRRDGQAGCASPCLERREELARHGESSDGFSISVLPYWV